MITQKLDYSEMSYLSMWCTSFTHETTNSCFFFFVFFTSIFYIYFISFQFITLIVTYCKWFHLDKTYIAIFNHFSWLSNISPSVFVIALLHLFHIISINYIECVSTPMISTYLHKIIRTIIISVDCDILQSFQLTHDHFNLLQNISSTTN